MDDAEFTDIITHEFARHVKLRKPKQQICKHGHVLSGENVRFAWADRDHIKKTRICVTCAKMRKANHWALKTPEKRAERSAKQRATRLDKKENP